MKKIVLAFIIIIIGVVGLIVFNHHNNDIKYTEAIQDYMADLASKKKESTCFYETKYFGKHYENVYAWVVEQCYYQEDNKLVLDSSSSMAYRFYHEDDVIKSYENPTHGADYQKSMEELFPLVTRNKMEKYSKEEVSKIKEQLEDTAKTHFGVSEITYETYIQNPSFGGITKITVDSSKSKIKRLVSINKREIYGIKDTIYVYDKDNQKHELVEALDNNDININQIERFLISESETNKSQVENTEDGKASIYQSNDYKAIVCTKESSNHIYFGDKTLEYKESYCK